MRDTDSSWGKQLCLCPLISPFMLKLLRYSVPFPIKAIPDPQQRSIALNYPEFFLSSSYEMILMIIISLVRGMSLVEINMQYFGPI